MVCQLGDREVVAPMNESDLLSPDYDSVVKKDALKCNLIINLYIVLGCLKGACTFLLS